ncbi:glycosyltransferase [Ornithobacterium rhinotracheale]|uniref:Glycosyl transferase n=1 Tax=Ornithobacterium rhinotracheale (strain ATCC 51463 / DSM 15997 / CCUG 23171 / CIP 104009 / LMG 9086) TaxID=867902 RepID=I3ZZD8_ORNRL|nr:glycosyltransferase [Ornithobacterium rhinotracheale]AFL97072.1 glycosyl transferase [Ornithobacterium rhinotracheale DSM 15997]AIQ00449.1 hypothetical protein Q785_04955 [Ornithobacterium rhinotracheale ORT-UMN 88]KGB67410.1 hypothetical protein Q787_04830 [Ornithobacterium rhinotracheale H06-030791]MBN3662279.1 glycosyltransferase [Ornithobacterium rhinotracheale]MCK0194409.1 glycosyltransferase [Ornithobacterium rhinotracheale]
MKLSIIIPVYNCASHLEIGAKRLEALYKLLDKNEFEIIYINDGSTDNSEVILQDIAKQKSNITIISQANQGLSGARNTGIKNANGERLVFLDADDWLTLPPLIELLEISLDNNLDLVGFKIQFVDSNEKITGIMDCHTIKWNTIGYANDFFIEGFQPSSACQFIYNTQYLKKNNLLFHPKIYHEDVEFTARLMCLDTPTKVYFSDKTVYNYLQEDGSMSKPKNIEKLHKLLYDEILVAELIKKNWGTSKNSAINEAIQKNYNAIVWNLLWRFYKKPNEVDASFKENCIKDLKDKKLYPIKGPLKTRFQNMSKYFMNNPFILNKFIIKK